MTSRTRSQLVFGMFALVVVAAVGVLSAVMLTLEANDADSRTEAQRQEAIRVTIARMESRISPLLRREAARPYFHYAPFHAADEAYSRMLRPLTKGDVLVPSPLLTEAPEFCRLHFQVAADGTFSSPRVPTGNLLDIAEMSHISPADAQAAREALDQISGCIEGPKLVVMVCGESLGASDPAAGRWLAAEPGIEVGAMTPRWIDRDGTPELVMVRSLQTPRAKFVQGVWLDWGSLQRALLEEAAELLPDARIEAAVGETPIAGGEPSRTLASLPVTLVPGSLPVTQGSFLTPTRGMLAVAWLAVLASLVAVALVVRTLAVEGERRGRFVSAVTHELRTPLTTFRMYAHMLADGTAEGEPLRRELAETLRDESDRLQRVVESVLAYARLSDSSARPDLQRIDAHEAITTIVPVLERCADKQDMQVVSALDGLEGAEIVADKQSLERVLVNLVDNACRHAGGSPTTTDRHIHVLTAREGSWIRVSIADHGPGVSPRDRKRLFRPFATAHASNGAQAGLGLGLALARGLVRQHGGDLELEPSSSYGAVFTLTLPLA